jgi:hypothetical protein
MVEEANGNYQIPEYPPLLADLSGFRLAKIKVDGMVGKTDVSCPSGDPF